MILEDDEKKKKPSFDSFDSYKQWLSGINSSNNAPQPNGEGNNVLSDERLKSFVVGTLSDERIKRLLMMGLLDNNYYSKPDLLKTYIARSFR